MSDYISRDAALAFQDELAVLLCKDVVTGDVMSATKDADLVKYLLSIPAADVRPVVRAKWVYTDMSRLVCSNCGNPVAFALKEDGWHHGDFCPNCGADMREES